MLVRVMFASLMLFAVVSAQAQDPQWLTEARAREAKPITARDFKSKDKWATGRVPGKIVGVIEKVDDSYSIEIDFGAESYGSDASLRGAPLGAPVVPEV